MNRKLTALIVDDEESARVLLKKLLEETLFFTELRMASSVNSANIELAEFDPDLIFLDIKMPGKDGFTFLRDFQNLGKKAEIIFVTAFDHFAIKAIKNQAFDYLLKPVDRKELRETIEKFIIRTEEKTVLKGKMLAGDPLENITRIRINTRTGTVFINPKNILYCKAEGNYTTISTGEKEHLCSMNLGKVEGLLPPNGFVRIGRSHIINFEYVTMLDRKESLVTLSRESETVKIKIPRQHLKELDIL
jgi:DNA-binding LytR/AlgR family response regulator